MVVAVRARWNGGRSLAAHDPWEAAVAHHVPTHRRSPLDADGLPQVSAMVALLAAAAVVLLVLATSAVSARLVG